MGLIRSRVYVNNILGLDSQVFGDCRLIHQLKHDLDLLVSRASLCEIQLDQRFFSVFIDQQVWEY
jgi:hypothetical protein